MSLVLEIECLTGVYRAAQGPASEQPDWPPQPDRVFSALVSAWATRGERREERMSLEWLEAQLPPTLRASGHVARTAPDVFVPPNDLRASRAAKTYLRVMPDRRPRQARRFPVARPDDPVMALVWEDEPDTAVYEALDAVARDVGYVGHSASLVRCRFLRGGSDSYPHPEATSRRRVYPGRLSELEAAHRADPVRPDIPPGASVPAIAPPSASADPSFWLVLEAINVDDVPDIRAAALVCRTLRRTLMSGYRRAELGSAVPEFVSGHAADGTPTRHPHLAIVPLPFAGVPHADGRVFGFALVPPSGTKLLDIPGLRRAFEQIAPYDRRRERRVVTLTGSPLPVPLRLAPTGASMLKSLSPRPYLRISRVWASVTPIVLDRHLKRNAEAEIRDIVADACKRAGLPRPDPKRIQAGKHSAIEGVPAARPSAGAPPWTRWKVPQSLVSRSLVHAVIDFEHEISGPVVLGAGRFTGLGLCRGLDS